MLDSTQTTPDYSNPVPAAIRRQSERVNEIAREAGVANVPDAEPALEPIATVVEPTPPVAVEPPPAPAAVPDDWEQRYRTLQGKYDSEIPGMRAQIDGLQRVIASIQTPPRAEPTPAPAAQPASTAPDPKEVEEFGEDLIALIERRAEAKFLPYIKQLEDKLGKVETTATTVVSNQAQQSVMQVLDNDPEIGTSWRVTNDSPEFVTWLNQVDPFTGHQRMRILRDAYAQGDAVRTRAFFKAFITEHTVVNPAPGGTPAHTPDAPAPGTGGPTLESLAAPGRASGPSSVGAPGEKRVWTNTAIAAFYRDVQKGAFAGRDAIKIATEQDIFAAASEGRVR